MLRTNGQCHRKRHDKINHGAGEPTTQTLAPPHVWLSLQARRHASLSDYQHQRTCGWGSCAPDFPALLCPCALCDFVLLAGERAPWEDEVECKLFSPPIGGVGPSNEVSCGRPLTTCFHGPPLGKGQYLGLRHVRLSSRGLHVLSIFYRLAR